MTKYIYCTKNFTSYSSYIGHVFIDKKNVYGQTFDFSLCHFLVPYIRKKLCKRLLRKMSGKHSMDCLLLYLNVKHFKIVTELISIIGN